MDSCAAHCIDLIFEDIGKRPSVIEVINNARKITNFIYNHGWLLAQMRLYCGGDIVRPGATRFATNYIALDTYARDENEPYASRSWRLDVQNNTRSLGENTKTSTSCSRYLTYFLNPRFQYRRGVGSDPELLQAVHDVFAKLDPTTESLGQFGNELVLFRDAKRGFGDRAAIAARSTMVPAEWWFMYGNQTPTLRKLAIKVLSQTASSTAFLEKIILIFLTFQRVGEEEDNQLFQWVRPIHLDDEVGNPDPRIAAHAREFGVNVERVLSEEVHSESFSKDTDDSHQEIDSTSAGHCSRPSVAVLLLRYDGSRGGTDDGVNIRSPIHCENTFTHAHRMKTMALEELVRA
ncbi:hypothetical protein AAG906_019190 [Vitis piasezkii]